MVPGDYYNDSEIADDRSTQRATVTQVYVCAGEGVVRDLSAIYLHHLGLGTTELGGRTAHGVMGVRVEEGGRQSTVRHRAERTKGRAS